MTRTITLTDDQAARLVTLARGLGPTMAATAVRQRNRGREATATDYDAAAAMWREVVRQLERAE